MKKMFGTVVPVVTPLNENDTIDIESVKRLVDHCINHGANFLYPCGSTGEMMYLTLAERKLVAEKVVESSAKRVPVFVQVGAWDLADTIELAQHACSIGADGIGVVTPSYFKISQHAMVDFYKSVSQQVPADFPIYIYCIPQHAINDITQQTAELITQACPNVIGIKYSYPDFTRIQELLMVGNGTFSVLAGSDHFYVATCAVGGDGVVSGNSSCIPEHYAKIWEAIQANDWKLAAKIQRRTNILNATMCAINNISAYKTILKSEGVISTNKMRRPLDGLSEEQEKTLLADMKKLEYRKVNV